MTNGGRWTRSLTNAQTSRKHAHPVQSSGCAGATGRADGSKGVERKSAPGPHEATGGEGTRGGAAEWTRTTDLLITNQLLYQLSYSSAGIESIGAQGCTAKQQPIADRQSQAAAAPGAASRMLACRAGAPAPAR